MRNRLCGCLLVCLLLISCSSESQPESENVEVKSEAAVVETQPEGEVLSPGTQLEGEIVGVFGLIGSGSLLVACRPDAVRSVIAAIHAAGIEACCIGDVLDQP